MNPKHNDIVPHCAKIREENSIAEVEVLQEELKEEGGLLGELDKEEIVMRKLESATTEGERERSPRWGRLTKGENGPRFRLS